MLLCRAKILHNQGDDHATHSAKGGARSGGLAAVDLVGFGFCFRLLWLQGLVIARQDSGQIPSYAKKFPRIPSFPPTWMVPETSRCGLDDATYLSHAEKYYNDEPTQSLFPRNLGDEHVNSMLL